MASCKYWVWFRRCVLYMADKTLPHMHFGPQHEAEGLPTHLKRTILLVFSITLHNIPEGLAVGVAFDAAATADNPTAAILAAVSVALGIGIQNFPEGAAVSIPLRQEGLSRKRPLFTDKLLESLNQLLE